MDLTNEQMAKLEELVEEFQALKEAETFANNARVECELAIADLIGGELGRSCSIKIGDQTITLNRPIRYSVDFDGIAEDPTIPKSLRPIKMKKILDTQILNYTEENDRPVFMSLNQYIDAKAGKPSIRIK